MATTTETSSVSFNQTEIWIDREGTEHRIDDMSVTYKANVVRFLERRAPRIVGRAIAEAVVRKLGELPATLPCADCDMRGITKPHEWEHGVWHGVGPTPGSEVDHLFMDERPLPTVTNKQAVDMIRRTPLMTRLINDIASNRGGEDD